MGGGKFSIGLHASHLIGLEVGEKTGRAKVAAMARLLIVALVAGGLLAAGWAFVENGSLKLPSLEPKPAAAQPPR